MIRMKVMARVLLALVLAISLSPLLFAGAPQTKVHKPTGDKIEVESGGEIEVKSGGTLDLQSGATLDFQGTITPPSGGWPLPIVDITVTTPTVAGLLVRTSASLVYVSTATVGVANWIKVGAQ